MKSGFTALKDKQGNVVSVETYKVPRMLKSGWRRVDEPSPKKSEGKTSTETG